MNKLNLSNVAWLMFPIMSFADYRIQGDALIYDDFYYSEDHEYVYNELVYVKKENCTGYTVVSAAETRGKEKEGHEKYQNERKEMQKNGYAYSDIYDPQEIFSTQYRESSEYPFLQRKVSDVELAFPYKGLDFIEEQNNMGYYGRGRYQNGWLEIAQFFRDPKLGICQYKRMNVSLAQVNIRLVAEDLSDEVNHKLTQYIVKGSDEVGYFAYIDWYDHIYSHTLQCGTEKFNPNYLTQVMALAIKIDRV